MTFSLFAKTILFTFSTSLLPCSMESTQLSNKGLKSEISFLIIYTVAYVRS